jgi:hypothetical protein
VNGRVRVRDLVSCSPGVSTSATTDCIKDALTVQLKFNAATVSITESGRRREILLGETSVRRKSVSLCRREGITRRGGLEEG